MSKLQSMEPAQRLFADIDALASMIRDRSAEIEAARRIPIDIVQVLKSIGVFRMFVPRSHDGLELDLPTGLEVLSQLARIDASVGWTAAIGNGGALFASILSRATYDQIYQGGPDVIFAGSIKPAGTLEAAPGAWRASGRWPFASGCQHADWMIGFCILTSQGVPLANPAGTNAPPIRGVTLPARDWQIEDTWHVAGLRGTGSHDIVLNEAAVPEAYCFDPMRGVPCVPGPLYRGVLQVLPLMHGAFSVGTATGALDDLLALANTGRQRFGAATPMRDSEVFQSELGEVAATLNAAKGYLRAQADRHWRHALDGTLRDEARQIEAGQTAAWLAGSCADIGNTCFRLGGSAALFDASPLQRRLRDLHAGAQHAAASRRHYIGAGKLLLGG